MRYGRRDSTHREIAQVLESVGATVIHTPDVGAGFPDLVVGYRGVTYFFEIKGPRGKLRPSQEAFRARWRGGPYVVVRTRDEALAVLGIITRQPLGSLL